MQIKKLTRDLDQEIAELCAIANLPPSIEIIGAKIDSGEIKETMLVCDLLMFLMLKRRLELSQLKVNGD